MLSKKEREELKKEMEMEEARKDAEGPFTKAEREAIDKHMF